MRTDETVTHLAEKPKRIKDQKRPENDPNKTPKRPEK